jgi:hypothetical protein
MWRRAKSKNKKLLQNFRDETPARRDKIIKRWKMVRS